MREKRQISWSRTSDKKTRANTITYSQARMLRRLEASKWKTRRMPHLELFESSWHNSRVQSTMFHLSLDIEVLIVIVHTHTSSSIFLSNWNLPSRKQSVSHMHFSHHYNHFQPQLNSLLHRQWHMVSPLSYPLHTCQPSKRQSWNSLLLHLKTTRDYQTRTQTAYLIQLIKDQPSHTAHTMISRHSRPSQSLYDTASRSHYSVPQGLNAISRSHIGVEIWLSKSDTGWLTMLPNSRTISHEYNGRWLNMPTHQPSLHLLWEYHWLEEQQIHISSMTLEMFRRVVSDLDVENRFLSWVLDIQSTVVGIIASRSAGITIWRSSCAEVKGTNTCSRFHSWKVHELRPVLSMALSRYVSFSQKVPSKLHHNHRSMSITDFWSQKCSVQRQATIEQ